MEAILKAQMSLPPGSGQNPEAILQAIIKAQGGTASDIPPEVIESILNVQRKLPPGAALNPQAVLQAVAAEQKASAMAAAYGANPVMQAAVKAQAEAIKSVTTDILELVIRAQKSLPAGIAQDPDALMKAIAEATGGSAQISPSVLAAVLTAQKSMPAGSTLNPQALLQSCQKLQRSLASGSPSQLPPDVLQSVLQSLPASAQAEIVQQQLGISGPGMASLPPAALASLIQAQATSGDNLASLPASTLVSIIQAQGGSNQNLSNLPPAVLAAIVQAQAATGQNISPAALASLIQAQSSSGGQLANISPAALASLIQAQGAGGQNLTPAAIEAFIQSAQGASSGFASQPGSGLNSIQAGKLATLIKSGKLPKDIQSQIPPHILEAASRMSQEELEISLGMMMIFFVKQELLEK